MYNVEEYLIAIGKIGKLLAIMCEQITKQEEEIVDLNRRVALLEIKKTCYLDNL